MMTKEERILYNIKVKERNRKHKENKIAELLLNKEWYLTEIGRRKNETNITQGDVERCKERRTKNIIEVREKANKYRKHRRKTDPMFKLTCNIRTLIYATIKSRGDVKKSKSYEILGCTYEEFKAHLEKQFTNGMNWLNQGEWHLDHIYPASKAISESHLIELNHYTNFQPLWAADNIRKGNKVI